MAAIRAPSDASRITRSTNNAAWLTRPRAQSQSSGAAAYPKGGFITTTSAFGIRREGSSEFPTTTLGNALASTLGSKGGRTLDRLAAKRVNRALAKRTKSGEMSHPPMRVPHASSVPEKSRSTGSLTAIARSRSPPPHAGSKNVKVSAVFGNAVFASLLASLPPVKKAPCRRNSAWDTRSRRTWPGSPFRQRSSFFCHCA